MIGEEIGQLFAAHGGAPLPEQEATLRAGVWLRALQDLPPWAVHFACSQWLSGKVPDANLSFAPSAPLIAKIAGSEVFRIRGLQQRLMKLLGAEVLPAPSAAQKAANEARFQRTIRGSLARSISDNARREAP